MDKKYIMLLVVVAVLAGAVVWTAALSAADSTNDKKLIKDYYYSENTVLMSPHDYIKEKQSGENDTILVDLRTSAEYQTLHLATAINIPAAQMGSSDVVAAFSQLPKDKTIVIHCYASYCMLAKNVGKLLVDSGIYVREMTAGWLEIKRDYSDFLVNGTEPGEIDLVAPTGCANGELDC